MRKRNVRRAAAVLLSLAVLTGCASPAEPERTSGTVQPVFYEMYGAANDSSELPDWTGASLNLRTWQSHGTGGNERLVSVNDVVSPEIQRITGVTLDGERSFDNGGQAFNVKLSMIAAANDWPDLVDATDLLPLKELIAAGKFYDLTDLIPLYCPNIMAKAAFDTNPEIRKTLTSANPEGDDSIYFFPHMFDYEIVFDMAADDFNAMQYAAIQPLSPRVNSRIWVRDDLLKMLYPNTKTQDEIEALYLRQGYFTKEDIFDVPIHTKEDFIDFLYDMQELIRRENITENGKLINVTYGLAGGDNWALMACLLPQISGIPGNVDYYTYYDKQSLRLEYMFMQDYFKEDLRQLTQLVRDDVLAKETLVMNDHLFNEALHDGEFAVTYAWILPNENSFAEMGKPYRYRELWPDVAYQDDRFVTLSGAPKNVCSVGIFKDSVKEEDLPQILRYLDFFASDIGEKLIYWGPETAGLWTEENGERLFTDKELAENMVYGKDNGKNVEYNLYNAWVSSAWPTLPQYANASAFHPRYTYTRTRNLADVSVFFNPGQLRGLSREESTVYAAASANYWNFGGYSADMDRFFTCKDVFEKSLTKILTAKDEAQFEMLYAEMLATAVQCGLTPRALDELNDAFMTMNKGIDLQ